MRRQFLGGVGCACVCALLLPSAASADLFCGSADTRSDTDSSGALVVTNPPPAPEVAAPLPAIQDGGPVYPRVDQHLPIGFNDGALHTGQTDPGVVGGIARIAGARIVRVSLGWSAVQPDAPPCGLHWGFADGRYHRLLSAGVRPLWVVQETPDWANPAGCGLLTRRCQPPPDADHIGAYADFVRQVARRYPLSAGVEVWNEPNLERYWHDPSSDPEHRAAYYDRLLAATWRAVHPAYPGFRVFGGVISEAGNDTASFGTSFPTFLARMRDDGALDDMTALAIHPYAERPPDTPEGDHFVRTFGQLGTILDPATAPRIVVTEIGIPVPGPHRDWTLQTQCSTVMDEYRRLDAGDPALPFSDRVDAVLFHVDIEGDGKGFGFGWLTQNMRWGLLPWQHTVASYTYTPGPAYQELRRTIGAGDGSAPDPAMCGSTRGAPLPAFPPDP